MSAAPASFRSVFYGSSGGKVRVDGHHFDTRCPLTTHADFLRRSLGKIDQAVPDEWAAIIHHHHDRALVLEVGHMHFRRKRQCAVSSGKSTGIEILPHRCLISGLPPVPGRDTVLGIAFGARHGIISLPLHRIGLVIGLVVPEPRRPGSRLYLAHPLPSSHIRRRTEQRPGRQVGQRPASSLRTTPCVGVDCNVHQPDPPHVLTMHHAFPVQWPRVQAEGSGKQLVRRNHHRSPRCQHGTARECFGTRYERSVGIYERTPNYILLVGIEATARSGNRKDLTGVAAFPKRRFHCQPTA